MSTYTADRATLVAALAAVIDFTPAMREEFGDFGTMAEAILSRLTAHEPTQRPMSADVEVRELAAKHFTGDLLARCQEAGQRLGAVHTDFRGNPCSVAVPPAPSRSNRLRALADRP